jgi:D-alanyl-D-alanine carboxypeptidase
LLREGYSGIKTGLTATAGGCLASLASIRKSKYDYQSLLIIVLGSEGADSRFEDTRFIVADYKKYL